MRWTCYAKPAALGGKTCGHKNEKGITSRSITRRGLLCCEECGCSKIASDSRKAEAK